MFDHGTPGLGGGGAPLAGDGEHPAAGFLEAGARRLCLSDGARSAAAASATPGDLELGILGAALGALPLPAGLTSASGDVLCANRELLTLLGRSDGPIRLPLLDPAEGAARRRQDVLAGRIWIARGDGVMLDPLVVTVGLGAEGRRLYLVADPGWPTLQATGRIAETPPRPDAASRLASLTLRETQVLRLLIADGSNKAVARELGISPRTVEVHRGRLLRKLGARSLAQAFAVAITAGLWAGGGAEA